MLHGLRHHSIINEIELIEDYPSKIAQLLIDHKIDLGLIPVSAATKLSHWHIVSDYCIGCDGPVASVCLFSDVPMERIEKVYLDYQSRTSVNLARILLKEFWRKEVELVNATGEDYREQIKGTAAGVVIGDRALEQRKHSKYIYDLGEAWKTHTGLPFVFAAWISNKKLPEEFIRKFNEAIAEGFFHLDEIIAANDFPFYNLKTYFTKNIDYHLDDKKREALKLFLEKLAVLAN